ncbi:MAG: hypothetical protein JWQ36_667, partial [Enterovirga sp.]|nr:hypothetical protein [Enterovirga sp.]
MKLLATEEARGRKRDGRWRRVVRRTFYVKLAVAFGLLLVLSAFYLRLVAGPVSLAEHSERLGSALAARIGPGWRVELTDTVIELQQGKPAVRTSGLEIRNPAGQLVVRAPYAIVSIDPTSLIFGVVAPREIELRDLQLVARIARDGSLSVVPPADAASAEPGAAAANAAQEALPAAGSPSRVSRAIVSLLAPVLGRSSLISALDRASVANARLTVLGADGRERAAFTRVNALFDRAESGRRRMSVALDGPGGAWRVSGEIGDTATGQQAELEGVGIPLSDALLLTGLSSLPAAGEMKLSADLKLSGVVSASLAEGRLTEFGGR